jgi:hypothetical protein
MIRDGFWDDTGRNGTVRDSAGRIICQTKNAGTERDGAGRCGTVRDG